MAIIIFEHSDASDAGRLGEVLRDFGHKLDVRRMDEGDPAPPDVDDVDGIVVAGGPFDPTDETLAWMNAEVEYLRRASAQEVPIVGICLGCQLLGRALGGEVGAIEGGGPGGQGEFGWLPVRLTEAGKNDVIHAGVGWTTMQPHWHSYEVKKLPAGATLLASSATCTVQAWSLGTHLYAFQYHPEIDGPELTRWADDEPARLKSAGLTREQLVADTDKHLANCQRIAMRMFTALASYLMPIDRRFAGISKGQRY